MKTHANIFLLVFLSAISFNTFSQSGTIIVFAPKGEKFTLFLGSTEQNHEPSARVESNNPGGPSFKIRVIFPDPSIKEISKLVFNKPGSTMYYKVGRNAKGVYALESTSSEWTDETNLADPGNSTRPRQDAPYPEKKDEKSASTKSESTKSTASKGCDNPIPDADFTAQLIDISARPFEPMQLSAAKKMAETHCLRVSQVKLVMNVFDTESSRLSFAKFAYDFTNDRENYSEVDDELHSQKSRDDLGRYIAGKAK
jgi:hypothetical protein